MLRSLARKHPKKWEFVISQVEFAYNNSINHSKYKPTFDVVYGKKKKKKNPNQVLDLLPLSNVVRVRMGAEEFAGHIKVVHEQIREQLKLSSQAYKSKVDAHRICLEFKEGDLVKVFFFFFFETWLKFICKKKDFELVLMKSSSKGSLVHAKN